MFSPADPDTGDIAQRANGSTLHSAPSVLRIENLKVTLPLDAGRPYAINDVSFDIQPNETVCVVGESGSGKTLLSLAVLRYLPRGVHVSQGRILFAGRDMATFSKREIQDIRGKRISMIFQEPMVSLNPTMTIGHQLEEIFLCHETMNAKERQEAVFEALADVDLHDVKRAYSSYPHQISGGQCQRVCIAMALALRPSLLIADEPTTALDVTTQRIILDLFMRLREKHQYACMFVTHDLAVVREIADRVVVMRHGQAVEMGAADAVLQHPRHAYTQRLLASIPPMEIDAREPLPSQAPWW